MKLKVLCALFCLTVISMATGCGSDSSETAGRSSNNKSSVESVPEAEMAEADASEENSAIVADVAGTTENVETVATGESENVETSVSDLSEADDTMTADESEKSVDIARQSGLTENAPTPEASSETVSTSGKTKGIDVDLTALSSTMVYSEVYNMMASPEQYVGKTIKMNGLFTAFHDPETEKNYFTCIIKDATACCSQGIEFELKDDYSYPEDYPQEGEDVTVKGVFDTYIEGQYRYCTLREADLVGRGSPLPRCQLNMGNFLYPLTTRKPYDNITKVRLS